jgi:enoyl-CoA hydratase/carnithine racemase
METNESNVVLLEDKGSVRWITINRAKRRNAINKAVVAGIMEGIASAPRDGTTRAIVLTGAGDRAFCAGGDLNPNAQAAPFENDPANPQNYIVDLFKLVQECTIPLVARVNGHALAGGFGLLCACDLAVAVRAATFGTPESKIGIFPMMIMPHLLRVVPPRMLMEMSITGEPISADEALAANIVNYVVEDRDLDCKLEWLLERITSRSPTAIRLGKQAFHSMRDMQLREGFEFAQVMLNVMGRTKDAARDSPPFVRRELHNGLDGSSIGAMNFAVYLKAFKSRGRENGLRTQRESGSDPQCRAESVRRIRRRVLVKEGQRGWISPRVL